MEKLETIVIKGGYSLYTEITIDAKPEKVWQIFADFKNYPNWNPFLHAIEGQPVVGQKITIELHPPDASKMKISPKMLRYEPNKSLVWMGSLLMPYIFDGEHHFEFEALANGQTRFRHYEVFRGLLVPLLKKMLNDNTRRGFEQMNAKLKELAEKV